MRDLASADPREIRRALSLLSHEQRVRLAASICDRLMQVPPT